MINLSRRSFLIGTSAAVAAAALPFSIPLVNDKKFVYRRYYGIDIGGIDAQPEGVRTVSIFRKNSELPLHRVSLNNQGMFHWWAPEEYSIIVPSGDVLRIDVEGGGNCQINLTFEEKGLDGSMKSYLESHTFPSKGPAEITSMEA